MITRSDPDVDYIAPAFCKHFGLSFVVRTGPFVHLSGIAPVRGDLTHLELVGPGDARAQTAFVLRVMDDLLASEGMTRAHLASWTTYATDVAAVVEAMPDTVAPYMGEHRPTNTLIGVTSLFMPGQLIEISAIAYDG